MKCADCPHLDVPNRRAVCCCDEPLAIYEKIAAARNPKREDYPSRQAFRAAQRAARKA